MRSTFRPKQMYGKGKAKMKRKGDVFDAYERVALLREKSIRILSKNHTVTSHLPQTPLVTRVPRVRFKNSARSVCVCRENYVVRVVEVHVTHGMRALRVRRDTVRRVHVPHRHLSCVTPTLLGE
jgi:hypothetical protein